MNIDLAFLQEETKTLQTITIPSPLKAESRFRFSAIAEDMDNIEKAHIYEGEIWIGRLIACPEDSEDYNTTFGHTGKPHHEIYKSDVTIRSTGGNAHYEIHGRLEEVIEKVTSYPTNQKRLIIKTLQEGWHIGLFHQILEVITTTLRNTKG